MPTDKYKFPLLVGNESFKLPRDFNALSKSIDKALDLQKYYVDIREFGAIGDYYLPDGTINPNPTDNSAALVAALAFSKKIRASDGTYYFSQKLNAPKNMELNLNGATFIFLGDGIDLGNHVYSSPKIYNGRIRGLGTGRGILYTNGYVVHPYFDVYVSHFTTAWYLNAPNDNSNLTWGKVRTRIEYCDFGLHMTGGWANSVKFESIHTQYIQHAAVLIENCTQMHNFIIGKLDMEQCAKEKMSTYSPFHIKGSYNGEITIYDAYIEGNGWDKVATEAERTTFMTTGVKVSPYFVGTDSKSWELNGEIYSEDTGRITLKDLQGQANFRFDNSQASMILNLRNAYVTTNVLGIASFNNAPVTINIDTLNLTNQGFSFPNIRKLFTNLTPVSIPKVIMKNVTNQGGGANLNYGTDVTIVGERFTVSSTAMNFAVYTNAQNTTLTASATTDIPFTSKTTGNLDLFFIKKDSDTVFRVEETGLYQITLSFLVSNDITPGATFSVFQSGTNRIGKYIATVKGGELNSLDVSIRLVKGDTFKIQVKNLATYAGTLIGSNNGTFFMNITKLL